MPAPDVNSALAGLVHTAGFDPAASASVSLTGSEPTLRKQPTPLLDIRIVDEEMNPLPPGTPGECVVRGVWWMPDSREMGESG